jgi:hypothetical protein
MITALSTIVYTTAVDVVKWTAQKTAGLAFLTIGLPWVVRYAVSYLYAFTWYFFGSYFQQVDVWLGSHYPASMQPMITLTGVAAYMAIQTDLLQQINIVFEGLGIAYVVADLRRRSPQL